MTYRLTPGPYAFEVDQTERIDPLLNAHIGAIVVASNKGPTVPTFVNQGEVPKFDRLYGPPDATVGFQHFCARRALQEGPLWVMRAHNGAKYAVGHYINNPSANSTSTMYGVSGSGETYDYTGGARQIQDLTFSAALVTSNVVNMTVNTVAITAVTYATSNNNTLTLVAAAIQSKLDAVAAGGKAVVVDTGTANNRVIRIFSPPSTQITVAGIAVTAGASQATGTMSNAATLFSVYAENPGKWAGVSGKSGIGVKIESVDAGVKQKQTLTFSAPLVASNVFNVNINGVAITPVTYATSSDATVAAIAAAIKVVLDSSTGTTSGSATVVAGTAGTTTDDLQIIITAPIAGTNVTIDTPVVTAGASQATVSTAETLTGKAADGTFVLSVYSYDNQNLPIKSWRCSLTDQVDGLGNQLFIEDQINTGPQASEDIRVVVNDLNDTLVVLNADTSINWLQGGTDGSAVSSTQIMAGWDAMKNRNKYPFRLMINGGFSTVAVQQKMVSLAESRRDCFAILDMPSAYQDTTSAINYRQNTLNIDSSWGGIYSPDLQIFDDKSGRKIYIPPSGDVAAAFMSTARNRAEWFAAAGLNRGKLKVLGLRVDYEEGDTDRLFRPAQINPIINKGRGKGPVIWGDATLQTKVSDLQSSACRMLLITITTSIVDSLDYATFDPNDQTLRDNIKARIEAFLEPIKRGRGIKRYRVVADESNNTADVVDARQMHIDVYFTAILPALDIRLQAILLKNAADINEAVSTGGNF